MRFFRPALTHEPVDQSIHWGHDQERIALLMRAGAFNFQLRVVGSIPAEEALDPSADPGPEQALNSGELRDEQARAALLGPVREWRGG